MERVTPNTKVSVTPLGWAVINIVGMVLAFVLTFFFMPLLPWA